MEPTALPLRDVLAAGLKQVRQQRGLRQEEAAARIRQQGLTSWIRGTVAQAEVGARRFSIEELLLLALALDASPADFITSPDDQLVELAPGAHLTAAALRALLSGDRTTLRRLSPKTAATPSVEPNLVSELLDEARRSGLDDPVLIERAVAAVSDAERHVARKVGTTPEWVNLVALSRWERTWSEERDRRLAGRAAEATPRQLQAMRGHITRELLTELEDDLKAGASPDSEESEKKASHEGHHL
ncbi:hypothetical protein EDD96_4515 [Streptomyces sp. Ag109_G2-6]|uniref:hypothetical protein n=1 Tax=Streptomyces TaxID=1883 RepID=UPI0009A4AD64|nr:MULTISPECIES: hypothetical protein [Streptomyces]RPF40739.1 hypothetical protein EDD96_4515 [Streptomyces sp. Ag109_G2-6]